MKISELASKAGARLENCPEELEITGLAPVEEATVGQLAFVPNANDLATAKRTHASAVILPSRFPALPLPMLRGDDAYLVLANVVDALHEPVRYEPGIHPTAVIHPSARVGARASIGAFVVIDRDVEIGADAVILPHVVIYRGARIGRNFFAHAHAVVREYCRLGDNVTLQNGAVIGGDGFGFAEDVKDGHATWKKLAHHGCVVLHDDVEVQTNACVDRSPIGATRIGRDVKIGALATVGHEATVDERTIVCPQVGIAGATNVGKDVVLFGQVGVAGDLTIGDGVTVMAQSGVASDVPQALVVSGSPAIDHMRWLRCTAILKRLPELTRALRASATTAC